jgi:hypothetical protein
MWGWPERVETKAMRLPSGDHEGEPSVAGSVVSLRGLDPSALQA